MDRALDEIVQENQKARRARGGGRGPRRDDRARDQDRKNGRGGDRKGIDDDWIHDRYDDESGDIRGPSRFRSDRNRSRRSPDRDREESGAKLRVENLHYELTEDDLDDLFNRIAPVTTLTLTYDRAGRSTGTAYVTYRAVAHAREAIREFDGANANGQPIRLSLVPPSSGGGARRNPFDTAVQPGRSLLDRVADANKRDSSGGRRARSRSPRRSDVTRPAPEYIDRYIPGDRSRSPPPGGRRRRGGGGGGRGGDRDRDGRRGNPPSDHRDRTGEGARLPRKTQEQLDKEMDDYWNQREAGGAAGGTAATGTGTGGGAGESMEIEMAE